MQKSIDEIDDYAQEAVQDISCDTNTIPQAQKRSDIQEADEPCFEHSITDPSAL